MTRDRCGSQAQRILASVNFDLKALDNRLDRQIANTIVSWEDAEALRYWLNWALGARTGRRSGL